MSSLEPLISILIVDSYESSRDILARWITANLPSAKLDTADNLRDGLDICKVCSIDIIILCIGYPSEYDYTILDSIKAINDDLQFIVVTGSSDKDELTGITKITNTSVLDKPVNLGELMSVLLNSIAATEHLSLVH